MNSDKIERLQQASAMTAPEVSRSTETLLPTTLLCFDNEPKTRCFELRLRNVGLCTSWCDLAAQNLVFGLLQVSNSAGHLPSKFK